MSNNLEEILKTHILNNKLYPRPRLPCPDCNGILKVCGGPKVKTHLRHEVKSEKCKVKTGDQFYHTLAIEILLQYLNQGRKVIYERKCKSCSEVIKLELKAKSYNKEVSLLGCRFDITGFIDDKISCGIEVYNKHRTSNIENRNFVEWTEVRADHILRELSEGEKQEIILEDIREIICEVCMNDIREKQKLKNEAKTSDIKKDETNFILPGLPISSEMKVHTNILKNNTYIDEKLKEKYRKIAITLGYLNTEYNHESEKIMHIAVRGKYLQPYYYWDTQGLGYEDLENKDKKLWNELIENKKCLKCFKDHKVTWFRPFCRTCYSEVKRSENKEIPEAWISVSREIRDEYRKQLSWMNDIPIYSLELSCVKCEDNVFVGGNNWWFGEKKRICYDCIIFEMEKRNITLDLLENE